MVQPLPNAAIGGGHVERSQDASAILNGERLYSFSAIATKVPGYRDNTRANASTIYRWAMKGVRTSSGTIIKLEAVRLGAAWKTSLEAVARFSAKLTAAANPSPDTAPAPTVPTPNQRARAASQASRELDTILGVAGK